MGRPKFAVIVGYFIPADSQWDPAQHSRTVKAFAETSAWAHVLASRLYVENFVHGDDVDDQGYTEVVEVASGRRASVPARTPVAVCEVDDDLPF